MTFMLSMKCQKTVKKTPITFPQWLILVWPTVQNSKNITFLIILDKQKQQVFTFFLIYLFFVVVAWKMTIKNAYQFSFELLININEPLQASEMMRS